MKQRIINLILLSLILNCFTTYSQTICTNPAPPMLKLISVSPQTGFTDFQWTPSPSSNVAAYLIYIYHNENGIPRGDIIDTIWDPAATNYTYHSSISNYYSVAFVMAAFRSPNCTSSFSNILNTVFTTATIDTCNKRIKISWNLYPSLPRKVTSYSVLMSLNGGSFTEAGKTASDQYSFTLSEFISNAEYCFVIRADLEDGSNSLSNRACLSTKMQRPPDWINADYATIDNNQKINLSFTVDPLSKISTYRLERKAENESDFHMISRIESTGKNILYADTDADPLNRYYYRLQAVNNCGNAIVSSNIAGNIVAVLKQDGDFLNLKWNSYVSWLGKISGYNVFMDIGNGFLNVSTLPPSDTLYSIDYHSIMYSTTTNNICFYIRAVEKNNPYGITGESSSINVCSEVIDKITVPNAFTPNNDLLNDLFKPVLSFTPAEYHFIVTDRQNKILFESHDHLAEWDGKLNGVTLPEGVYLWFLKVKSPSGNILTRTGTVTILK